jgi:hypothetical protein
MANTETGVMRRILLALTGTATLFRNNVGARKLDDGTFLRYGVGGKGGPDIIGLRSIVVGPQHVGRVMAVFVAIEVKTPEGRTTPEQDHFLKVVAEAGGLAGVARSEQDAFDAVAL